MSVTTKHHSTLTGEQCFDRAMTYADAAFVGFMAMLFAPFIMIISFVAGGVLSTVLAAFGVTMLLRGEVWRRRMDDGRDWV